MNISNIRLRRVTGVMETDGPFWEERAVSPADIYDDFGRRQHRPAEDQIDDRHIRFTAIYVQVEADDGLIGIGGPVPETSAYIVARELRSLLVGRDPIATELLWDLMLRTAIHSRGGDWMQAIGTIDCALWDLKGRWLDQPIYRLLGGPTRRRIPAHVSMAGYGLDDPGLVRERALMAQRMGFRMQKWFARHGPGSGPAGLKSNVTLIRTLREALGDDDDIMLDCSRGWNYEYTLKVAKQIEEYDLRWLEECVPPDRVETLAEIRRKISIPLSGGESEYGRWGFRRLIDARAIDIVQPDVYMAGGLSETLKIAAYASANDLVTILHSGSSPAGVHFAAAQSPAGTPQIEYGIRSSLANYYFLRTPPNAVDGFIELPDTPGLGMDLDKAKIDEEEEVRF